MKQIGNKQKQFTTIIILFILLASNFSVLGQQRRNLKQLSFLNQINFTGSPEDIVFSKFITDTVFVAGNSSVKIIDINAQPPQQHQYDVSAASYLALSKDKNILAIAIAGEDYEKFQVNIYKAIFDYGDIGQLDNTPDTVTSVAISPDNNFLITGDVQGVLKTWELTNFTTLGNITTDVNKHTGAVNDILYNSSVVTQLLTGGEDGKLLKWNLQDNTILNEELYPNPIKSISQSNDSTKIAVCTGNTIQIINYSDFSAVGTLNGHTDIVYKAKFLPSDRMIVTGSEDTKIMVWRISDAQKAYEFTDHQGGVTDLDFSSGNSIQLISTGSSDFSVKLWDIICEDGTYGNATGLCEDCSKKCGLCDKSDECVTCENQDFQHPFCPCPDGTYDKNNACFDCTHPCENCRLEGAEQKCTTCVEDTNRLSAISDCACKSGYAQSPQTGKCIQQQVEPTPQEPDDDDDNTGGNGDGGVIDGGGKKESDDPQGLLDEYPWLLYVIIILVLVIVVALVASCMCAKKQKPQVSVEEQVKKLNEQFGQHNSSQFPINQIKADVQAFDAARRQSRRMSQMNTSMVQRNSVLIQRQSISMAPQQEGVVQADTVMDQEQEQE